MPVKKLEYYAIINWSLLINRIKQRLISEGKKPNIVDIDSLGLSYPKIKKIIKKWKIDNMIVMQLLQLSIDISDCISRDTI
jgi:hypothetical protein